MIPPSDFFNFLKTKGIEFFTGVPDSRLKSICAYISDNTTGQDHIITANEGNAIAVASGFHLSTGKIGLVYMQNSGLGNALNPLTSLANREVYKIPVLLLIGWRGRPGEEDEPQHIKKGKITLDLLELLEIPYEILGNNFKKARNQTEEILNKIQRSNTPGAIIVGKDVFQSQDIHEKKTGFKMCREDAIKIILEHLSGDEIIIATTGKISRELYKLREERNEGHHRDFLNIGSMGHASSIALGIALKRKDRKVLVLDGDGSIIMHMGSLAVNGESGLPNYKHVVLNNGVHDSVGGQPTAALNINLANIAKNCNYRESFCVEDETELLEIFPIFLKSDGASFLEVKINRGGRVDLGRPPAPDEKAKKAFMDYVMKL